MLSQNQQVLHALQRGEHLTALRAVEEFGCLRLAARINDLRNDGYSVEKTVRALPNGKRIAVYSLANATYAA